VVKLYLQEPDEIVCRVARDPALWQVSVLSMDLVLESPGGKGHVTVRRDSVRHVHADDVADFSDDERADETHADENQRCDGQTHFRRFY